MHFFKKKKKRPDVRCNLQWSVWSSSLPRNNLLSSKRMQWNHWMLDCLSYLESLCKTQLIESKSLSSMWNTQKHVFCHYLSKPLCNSTVSNVHILFRPFASLYQATVLSTISAALLPQLTRRIGAHWNQWVLLSSFPNEPTTSRFFLPIARHEITWVLEPKMWQLQLLCAQATQTHVLLFLHRGSFSSKSAHLEPKVPPRISQIFSETPNLPIDAVLQQHSAFVSSDRRVVCHKCNQILVAEQQWEHKKKRKKTTCNSHSLSQYTSAINKKEDIFSFTPFCLEGFEYQIHLQKWLQAKKECPQVQKKKASKTVPKYWWISQEATTWPCHT